MKHKPGGGRKVRRQRKVFKLKKGGRAFEFSGRGTSWGNQSMVPLAVSRAKWIEKEYKKARGDR